MTDSLGSFPIRAQVLPSALQQCSPSDAGRPGAEGPRVQARFTGGCHGGAVSGKLGVFCEACQLLALLSSDQLWMRLLVFQELFVVEQQVPEEVEGTQALRQPLRHASHVAHARQNMCTGPSPASDFLVGSGF